MTSLDLLAVVLPIFLVVDPAGERQWSRGTEDLSSATMAPAPLTNRPIYLASDERSALPGRFRYRGASFGVGGGLYFDTVYCDAEVTADTTGCEVGKLPPLLLEVTPLVDVLTEFGWRHVRLVLGAFTLPRPHLSTDASWGLLIGVEGGILFGYERLRVGLTAGGGYAGYQVLGRLLAMPWRDGRGHRHGLEAAIGSENWHTTVLFAYRFAPAAFNHIGGRRAAKRHSSR